jgi:hypothetical protein
MGVHIFDSILIHMMDPESSYLLNIRLSRNPKKRRKEFACFHISKVVDDDRCNFMDLVQEIVDAYPHGYNEVVSVFYYDELQNIFPQVTIDQELLAMFSKHVHSKVVRMTITYTEPGDVVPIPEPYTSENSEVLDIPSTPSVAYPVIPQASQSTMPSSQPSTNELADDDILANDGILANPKPQNEHVGIDDEVEYLTHGKSGPAQVESSDSESDEEYEEEDGLVGKDPLPPTPVLAYDKNNPPMCVGSIYPNMREFRLALQNAIKHEFEFNIEKVT